MTRDAKYGKCLRALDRRIIPAGIVFGLALLVFAAVLATSARSAAAQEIGASNPAATTATGGTVFGTVSSSTGAPVAYARIEAVGTSDTTIADSAGSYVLSRLPAGTSTLRITRAGLAPLTVRVIVPRAGRIRVDVILSQSTSVIRPEPLPPVLVRPPTVAAVPAQLSVHTPGVWEWRGQVADAPETTGEPDVFRLLVSDPHAMMRSDGFGGTYVAGATGSVPDRVFVDGLPMWNPLHAGSSLGAIDPDVVSDLRVSDGAAAARNGGALFETVDVTTREAALGKPSSGVGLGPTAVRWWWGGPLRLGATTGQLLIAGRRSSAAVFPDRSDANAVTDRWSDGLAVLSLSHDRSAVQLVAIRSGDQFAADVDDAAAGATTDAAGGSVHDQMLDLSWRSTTLGATWTQHLSPVHTLITRVWDAGFETAASATATSGTPMSNRAREVGLGTELNLSSITVGASMESFRTSYNEAEPVPAPLRSSDGAGAAIDATTATTIPPSYVLRAAPTVLAAYAERHWGDAAAHWSANSGIRATALPGGAPLIEPRLSASVDIGRGVIATAGYASTHQFVQSIRDLASAGGALVPVSFPIAAGSAGVPVARAQTVTADLSRDLGTSARLTVGAYHRDFEGLVLPAAAAIPPATGGFSIVDGRTVGMSASVQDNLERLTTRMTYGVQRTVLSSKYAAGFPGMQLAQTASAAIEWRAPAMTKLRILSSIGSSFSDTPNLPDVDGGVDETARSDATARELSAFRGPVFPDRFPIYMRIDVGAIREWPTTGFGIIGLTVTIANVLDRANVAAYMPTGSRDGERVVALTPRSLQAGITWRQ